MYNNGVNYYQPNATQQQMFRQPNTTAFPPTLQGLKGRPVASLEEVRAASIDFDGSVFFFPDLANNRIYTKQIMMDGTASLKVFELVQIPMEKSMVENDFITREEFNNVINTLKGLIVAPQEQAKSNEENFKF